ncbi:MAG: hypothetical protein HJJLKODD_02136 [Phycisphaerae bacterium]|nr:hypothetical protein [Phycisphaerae bacterium]
MKKNTWLLIAMALAVTAGAVIAKSVTSTPGDAYAGDEAQSMAVPPAEVNTMIIPAAAPTMLVSAPVASDQKMTNSDTIATKTPAMNDENEKAKATEGWYVLVVRGSEIKRIYYPNPDYVAPAE